MTTTGGTGVLSLRSLWPQYMQKTGRSAGSAESVRWRRQRGQVRAIVDPSGRSGECSPGVKGDYRDRGAKHKKRSGRCAVARAPTAFAHPGLIKISLAIRSATAY
jgi:hypothetical protein